jgi:hypothetical protein
VRVLVLAEISDLDVPAFAMRVPDDEAMGLKVAQEFIGVTVVVRENLGFDLLRTVFDTAFPVAMQPEASE